VCVVVTDLDVMTGYHDEDLTKPISLAASRNCYCCDRQFNVGDLEVREHTLSHAVTCDLSDPVNKKLSYRKRIARQQRTHSEFSGEGVFDREGSIWDIDGGDRCRKHNFQCGIVFLRGVVFHAEETFVTPLVAAAASINFTGESFSLSYFFHGEKIFVTLLVSAATRKRLLLYAPEVATTRKRRPP